MENYSKPYRVKENSIFARVARYKMKSNNIAMVLGKTIHLSGVSKERFLKNEQWLQHELVHIEQFKRYGFFKFLLLYFVESLKHGYHQNKYEVEARQRAGEE